MQTALHYALMWRVEGAVATIGSRLKEYRCA